jgi:hypothetical protein
MIEAIVISTIASRDVVWANNHIRPNKIRPFRDVALIDRNSSALYVPLRFHFKAIYALNVEINSATHHAHPTAIQFTVAKEHKVLKLLFFPNWRKWSKDLSGYTLRWSFLWIVPDQRGWKDVDEKSVMLRSWAKIITPEYKSLWVSLDQVDLDLDATFKMY